MLGERTGGIHQAFNSEGLWKEQVDPKCSIVRLALYKQSQDVEDSLGLLERKNDEEMRETAGQ